MIEKNTGNKDALNAAIENLWSESRQVEDWQPIIKNRKALAEMAAAKRDGDDKNHQSERAGGRGRGRSATPAGGRGAGRGAGGEANGASRSLPRPSAPSSSTPKAPMADSESKVAPAPQAAAPIAEVPQSKAAAPSKAPRSAQVPPPKPTVTAASSNTKWGQGSLAEMIKKKQEEESRPKPLPVPAPEPTSNPNPKVSPDADTKGGKDGKEKRPRKERGAAKKSEGSAAQPADITEGVLDMSLQNDPIAAAAQISSAINPTPLSAIQGTSITSKPSPKQYLKLGKFEQNLESTDVGAFQFGSFNFTADEPATGSNSAWGGVNVVSDAGEASSTGNVWAPTGTSADAAGSSTNISFLQESGSSSSQRNLSAPPGLEVPQKQQQQQQQRQGQNQGQRKNEQQQQQQQQQHGAYGQQPLLPGAPGRNAPPSLPYGYPFDMAQSQYMPPYAVAGVPAAGAVGAAVGAAPASGAPSAPAGQQQYPIQGNPYANPYFANPYYFQQAAAYQQYNQQQIYGRGYPNQRGPYGADPYNAGFSDLYAQAAQFPDASAGGYGGMAMHPGGAPQPVSGGSNGAGSGNNPNTGKQAKNGAAGQGQDQMSHSGYGYYNRGDAQQWGYGQSPNQGWPMVFPGASPSGSSGPGIQAFSQPPGVQQGQSRDGQNQRSNNHGGGSGNYGGGGNNTFSRGASNGGW